jgi:hypothetical protein
MEESKFGMVANFVSILAVVATAALSYIVIDTYTTKYALSKSHFVCTKIEQKGKNMDDVVCVQYTAQKYYDTAVSMNKMVYTK